MQEAQSSRPRLPRSCNSCARRKVKCDQAKPRCNRCVRGGSECIYAGYSAQPKYELQIIDETPALIADHTSASGRSHPFDSARTASLSQSSTHPPADAPPNLPLKQDPGYLYRGFETKDRYVTPDYFAMINEENTPMMDELLQFQQQYSIEDSTPSYERDSQGQSTAVKPSLTTPDDLTNSIGDESDNERLLYGDIFPHIPAWTSRKQLLGPYKEADSLDEVIAALPSSEQCSVLISAYMFGYQTVSPLFHGPSFLRRVRALQAWLQGMGPEPAFNSHFLALLTAVLFAGSVSCPRRQLQEVFIHESREDLSSRLYRHAIRAIRLSNFPQSPSLYSIAAFMISDSTWLREEQPLTCCSFVGVAVRLAQMLGLHKDPSGFPDISPVDAQVRRQIWWALVSIDTQVSLASGLPPLIDSSLYNVRSISEAPEAIISHDNSSEAKTKSVLGILVGGKYRFASKANALLHILHSAVLDTQGLDSILEIMHNISTEMKSRRKQIEELEQMYPIQDQASAEPSDADSVVREAEFNPALARFTKMVLSLMAAKPYAIIYGPVRRHRLLEHLQRKEPQALMYCKEYLHRFLQLTESHDFQPWHWLWPGQHQPLHSLMAIITDLGEHPNDPAASETKKLVDHAFYMCSGQMSGILSQEDGDPVLRPLDEGGSEAWNLLRRVRFKTWQKLGWDPHILRCPKTANDIHILYPGEEKMQQTTEDEMPLFNMWNNVSQDLEDWDWLGGLGTPAANLAGRGYGI